MVINFAYYGVSEVGGAYAVGPYRLLKGLEVKIAQEVHGLSPLEGPSLI